MGEQNNQLSNRQPQYYQPQQQPGYQRQAPVINIGDWIAAFIVLATPLINPIMAFMRGFEGNVNPSKTNHCKAWLVFITAIIILYVLLFSFVLGTRATSGRYS